MNSLRFPSLAFSELACFEMLDWSTSGLISFSNTPDWVIILFLDCSIHLILAVNESSFTNY